METHFQQFCPHNRGWNIHEGNRAVQGSDQFCGHSGVG